jgi:hypothetical protein
MTATLAAHPCKRCGRVVASTPSGHVRAHACPHGVACVLSYAARRRGGKARRCAACWSANQLSLFEAP